MNAGFIRTSFLATLMFWVAVAGVGCGPQQPSSTVSSAKSGNVDLIITNLPYYITNAGTYRLKDDLSVQADGYGIFIKTNHVVLELNGKKIMGGPKSNAGIVLGQSVSNVAVQNGAIIGWVHNAINGLFAHQCVFSNLLVMSNGLGMAVGSTNTVVDCKMLYNEGTGLNSHDHTTVKNCRSEGNRDDGFAIGLDSLVENCEARSNRVNGFYATQKARLVSCTAAYNKRSGFLAGTASVITNCTAIGNTYEGIETASGTLVQNNVVLSNLNNGITVFGHSTVISNRVVGHKRDGIRAAFGCKILENFCEGNGTDGRDTSGIHLILKLNRVERNHVVIGETIGVKASAAPNQVLQNMVTHRAASGGLAYDCKKENLGGPILLRARQEGDPVLANYELRD
jgi:hypothetical protein